MSNSLSEGPDDVDVDDAEREEIVRDAVATAINEFLYRLSIGYMPMLAFECAVDGDTNIRLRVPGELGIVVHKP